MNQIGGLLVLGVSLAQAQPAQNEVLVRMVDPMDQILPGATVSLIPMSECLQPPVAQSVTDVKGVARLKVPSRRRYMIRFELRGMLGGTVGPLTLSPDAPFHVTARMYTVYDDDHGITGEVPLDDRR
jgi:hypothetical protein